MVVALRKQLGDNKPAVFKAENYPDETMFYAYLKVMLENDEKTGERKYNSPITIHANLEKKGGFATSEKVTSDILRILFQYLPPSETVDLSGIKDATQFEAVAEHVGCVWTRIQKAVVENRLEPLRFALPVAQHSENEAPSFAVELDKTGHKKKLHCSMKFVRAAAKLQGEGEGGKGGAREQTIVLSRTAEQVNIDQKATSFAVKEGTSLILIKATTVRNGKSVLAWEYSTTANALALVRAQYAEDGKVEALNKAIESEKMTGYDELLMNPLRESVERLILSDNRALRVGNYSELMNSISEAFGIEKFPATANGAAAVYDPPVSVSLTQHRFLARIATVVVDAYDGDGVDIFKKQVVSNFAAALASQWLLGNYADLVVMGSTLLPELLNGAREAATNEIGAVSDSTMARFFKRTDYGAMAGTYEREQFLQSLFEKAFDAACSYATEMDRGGFGAKLISRIVSDVNPQPRTQWIAEKLRDEVLDFGPALIIDTSPAATSLFILREYASKRARQLCEVEITLDVHAALRNTKFLVALKPRRYKELVGPLLAARTRDVLQLLEGDMLPWLVEKRTDHFFALQQARVAFAERRESIKGVFEKRELLALVFPLTGGLDGAANQPPVSGTAGTDAWNSREGVEVDSMRQFSEAADFETLGAPRSLPGCDAETLVQYRFLRHWMPEYNGAALRGVAAEKTALVPFTQGPRIMMLANPSSYHGRYVRDLRKSLFARTATVALEDCKSDGFKAGHVCSHFSQMQRITDIPRSGDRKMTLNAVVRTLSKRKAEKLHGLGGRRYGALLNMSPYVMVMRHCYTDGGVDDKKQPKFELRPWHVLVYRVGQLAAIEGKETILRSDNVSSDNDFEFWNSETWKDQTFRGQNEEDFAGIMVMHMAVDVLPEGVLPQVYNQAVTLPLFNSKDEKASLSDNYRDAARDLLIPLANVHQPSFDTGSSDSKDPERIFVVRRVTSTTHNTFDTEVFSSLSSEDAVKIAGSTSIAEQNPTSIRVNYLSVAGYDENGKEYYSKVALPDTVLDLVKTRSDAEIEAFASDATRNRIIDYSQSGDIITKHGEKMGLERIKSLRGALLTDKIVTRMLNRHLSLPEFLDSLYGKPAFKDERDDGYTTAEFARFGWMSVAPEFEDDDDDEEGTSQQSAPRQTAGKSEGEDEEGEGEGEDDDDDDDDDD